MDEQPLVERIVRFAFLIRLAALLLVVFVPSEISRSPVGLTAVGFITLTSAFGLYVTSSFTSSVSAHPILLVLDVLVASVIGAVVGPDSPLMLYTLSTAVLIGILLRPRTGVMVLAILLSSFALVGIAQSDPAPIATQVLLPVCCVTVCALGTITRVLHTTAMREAAEVRRLSEDAARERERARLARDMHDSVAKSLHGIGLAAAALPTWAETAPELLPERARELQQAAEVASQDAREILVDLRTTTDDRTLAQQLRAMTDDLAQGGVKAELTVEGIGDCDHAIKRELVSIAGEAVENVRRHSGARTVELSCVGTDGEIVVRITDDGRGFEPGHTPDGHYGLVGMRERAEAVGGRLEVTSAPGRGTTVEVHAPRQSASLPGGTR
ncbi:sensor histidine kinase [Aeromicrobium terrae]|uniref:histidine kinase n=1 Tax=Aeromicrobium terrae TaxID=2498846 RepID=A0A5C8NME9_9ACTN|nr:ATP-binding protein [Aeromicrobium terrae]TXL62001.1 hypothetical protein FHP06_04620 [Aeromicrobium terrae]